MQQINTEIMSAGGENTFHVTKEDIRKPESQTSRAHGGNVPADSNVAALQSVVDKADKSKADVIKERQANLPLPEQPPVASDFNSSDASTVNVGSGGVSDSFSRGNDAFREPATGDSAVRASGDANKINTLGQGVAREGLVGGIPNDAVTRDAKDKAGLAQTTGKDYGYPQKNDPASDKQ